MPRKFFHSFKVAIIAAAAAAATLSARNPVCIFVPLTASNSTVCLTGLLVSCIMCICISERERGRERERGKED